MNRTLKLSILSSYRNETIQDKGLKHYDNDYDVENLSSLDKARDIKVNDGYDDNYDILDTEIKDDTEDLLI
ncbi:hypothetical protein M3181_14955 [Mesobacillus maritimus]|uniref:hypothetical protein n=1 Tax=Mesobacillus maritimus TaxID=1643336 RepID=UPI00203C3428|nr:hypothetical protein [Mesobacillus maritimus]MCM3670280.1 hypothetical protein [Mesobacillus maritimus]